MHIKECAIKKTAGEYAEQKVSFITDGNSKWKSHDARHFSRFL